MSLNWTLLVIQGRARSVGIPWTAEELDAVLAIARHSNKSMADAAQYVRQGIMTVEDYEKALTVGEKPQTREDLETEAKKAGVSFDPESTPDEVLEKETRRKNKKTK